MKTDSIFDVLGLVAVVALATTLVSSRNTASIISSGANGYARILSAALGK